ncbi:MAG: macro domain-containing protein [Lachnospiraceae bacterium]
MITYVKGDMFSSPAKIIVNAVNTVGVMGKGVALEFKKRYPDMFINYQKLCENKKLEIGRLFLWRKSEKWVLLFPTKQHWRNPSKLEYIESGLQKFVENWDKLGAESVAFPRLGCGNGGLDWLEVKPLMEKYLKPIPMQIYVYVDKYNDPVPEHETVSEIEKWLAGETELTGYEVFKARLKHFFESGKEKLSEDASIQYQDGFLCIEDMKLDDEQVCNLWNFVRDAGIVSVADIPYEYHSIAERFLEMLKYLNYVTGVIVSPDGIHFGSDVNAYQYIAD